MDNIEIIFKNFDKKNLDTFLKFELMKYKKMIKSSHFYDNFNEKDLTIEKVKSLSKILSPAGSGNIFFSDFKIGIFLGNTVVTFSFDENLGDITINFEMSSVFVGNKTTIIDDIKKIMEKVLAIKKEYCIPTILIGLEPADDKDTCLLKIDNADINLQETANSLWSSLNLN